MSSTILAQINVTNWTAEIWMYHIDLKCEITKTLDILVAKRILYLKNIQRHVHRGRN